MQSPAMGDDERLGQFENLIPPSAPSPAMDEQDQSVIPRKGFEHCTRAQGIWHQSRQISPGNGATCSLT